jgi:NitT/TauT family transport system substrate-binding protein
MSRRQLGTCAIAAAAGTALAGCSEHSSSTSTGSGAPDRVTYVTGFGQFGREGYVYVADAKGYFSEQGIKVTVVPGNAGDANVAQLDSGKAQFTVLDYGKALTLLGAGHRTFRLVAPIQQVTIAAVTSLSDRGIARPADLPGKRLVQAPGTIVKILFPAYARAAGFDAGAVRWLPDAAATALTQLLIGRRADGIGQFVVGAPALQAAAAKLPGAPTPVVLPYGDVISDLYGNVMVAPTRLIDSNPGLVRRFTTALLKGLAYAVTNPKEAGGLINRAVPATAASTAAAELTLMAGYTRATSPEYGAFDPARVMKGISRLESLADDTGRPVVAPDAKLRPESVIASNIAPSPAPKS